MDKRDPRTTMEKNRRGRVYNTISLYMDPAAKKKLFFSHTYNFENSDGEEFLIRLQLWTQELDKLPVHR